MPFFNKRAESRGGYEMKGGNSLDKVCETANRDNKTNMLFTVSILVCAVVWGITSSNGGAVTISLSDGRLSVSDEGRYTWVVEIDDIIALELVEEMDFGTIWEGESKPNIISGIYRNNEYGEYRIIAFADVGQYIVIHYSGGILVCNYISISQTESIYERLKSLVS